MYLDRFGDDGQVFVRRRGRSTVVSNTINVAVEAGFYDLDVTPPNPKHVEELLSDVEGATALVFRELDDSGEAPSPSSAERETLAAYLALQMSRRPEYQMSVEVEAAIVEMRRAHPTWGPRTILSRVNFYGHSHGGIVAFGAATLTANVHKLVL
jgi:hypothetical protein